MKRLRYAICFLLIPASLYAWEVQVTDVTDGDSITVGFEGREIRLELAGIDCPELDQPWGDMARQFTAYLAKDKRVIIWPAYEDPDGRLFAFVFVEDINLNKALLRAGLAWHYRKYVHDALLTALEMEARAAQKGLWGDLNPVPPWAFRNQRSDSPK